MSDARPGPVLILTAGMGAGHDRVAAEVAHRIDSSGVDVLTADIWDLLPLGLGRLISGFYRLMIRHLPWLYEAIYRIWLRPPDSGAGRMSPLTWLIGRRLKSWLGDRRPSVAVSTFHVATQVLGDLRRRDALTTPAVSLVVDFAAHGLWIDPHIDLNLCLHDSQAARLLAGGACRVLVPGPVVRPAFGRLDVRRPSARDGLGVDDDQYVVLIVAGSWGVGRVEEAVAALAGRAGLVPVVVSGRNEAMRRRLAVVPGVVVFGWVDDMEGLMAAVDVVVENAGGLTAMEAMAAGVPVVSFRPIPGHGRDNVIRMNDAGVSVLARSEEELIAEIERLRSEPLWRARRRSASAAIFHYDAVEDILAFVGPRQETESRSVGAS